MGDIFCAKCGEPWDGYGVFHGDMNREEVRKFLNGEGCPSCDFGRKKHFRSDESKEVLEEAFYASLAENIYNIYG